MSLSLYAIPGCCIEQVRQQDGELRLVVRAQAPNATCPTCRRRSTAPHSTYVRRPADLPSLGRGVRLELHVRRFYCRNARCARRTFAEALRGLIDRHAQRTRRLAAAQRRVAVQVGGEAGTRLAADLAMPTSADTLLRLVRKAPLPKRPTPRVLGVDDWALRRGRTYGTILVDLEARHVVDLLPDRTSHTLATWLRRRPAVAVIARDRSTEYARAATTAAPHALQEVADRWHLLVNVRDMAERWLVSVYPRLRRLPVHQAAPAPAPVPGDATPPGAVTSASSPVRRDRAFPKAAAERERSTASAARWRAVYDEVRRRHAAGEPRNPGRFRPCWRTAASEVVCTRGKRFHTSRLTVPHEAIGVWQVRPLPVQAPSALLLALASQCGPRGVINHQGWPCGSGGRAHDPAVE